MGRWQSRHDALRWLSCQTFLAPVDDDDDDRDEQHSRHLAGLVVLGRNSPLIAHAGDLVDVGVEVGTGVDEPPARAFMAPCPCSVQASVIIWSHDRRPRPRSDDRAVDARCGPSSRAGQRAVDRARSHRSGPGLILVVVLAPVAAVSGFGLLWFVPYAAVGALLAIRRPGTSIGWLMLALGAVHALAALPDAFPADAADASRSPFAALVVVLAGIGWPVVFALYAALAFTLPAGRLPVGRWGSLARASLAAAVACVALGLVPALADAIVLPMLGVLAASLVSLVVRARRAEGLERQQLRWVLAALGLVVMALVMSVTLATIVPDSAGGAAWLPVALAYPTVPLAIGIAVMRYRLYEIDMIIHGAIVYSLLTAILAGAAAAATAATQRLFQGLIGNSDITIVVTTLVIVAAFNPLKSWLQVRVDRRFGSTRDPAIVLGTFVTRVRESVSPLSIDRTFQGFVSEAVRAHGATGGEVAYTVDGGPERIVACGQPSRETGLAAASASGGIVVRVRLTGGVRDRQPDALQHTLEEVLTELAAPAELAAVQGIAPSD